MTKQEMRSCYLARRKEMPREERERAGENICNTLLRLPQLETAKTVMVYLSFGAEVDTHRLTEALLAQGKTVCAPLCQPNDCSMTPYYFDGISLLQQGAYGILEPKAEREANVSEIDVVLVPGCVFGENFHRIGYGKGYYDRFLPKLPRALKIGLCYDCCLVPQVEGDITDSVTDMIVTERQILRRT